MTQLQEPSAPTNTEVLSTDVIFLLLGIYGWEYFQSLYDIEWAFFCGRLAFRPSLSVKIPYSLGRACLLVFLVLSAVTTTPCLEGVNYLPVVLTIAVLGIIVLGCSSMNFLIRTWVIWKYSRFVHVLLLLLALGQWALLAAEVAMVRSININGVNQVYIDHPEVNAAAIIYTTLFNLLVFVLSVVGLSSERFECPLKRRLRTQGILYFAVAGIVYIPPVVAALVGDSFVFVLVSNIALTVSTIVSSRAVRSMHSLDTSDLRKPLEGDIALTTQIMIHPATVDESIPSRRHCIDEAADQC